MINQPNPYQRYKQTCIETASPIQLVVMLYDGALRFIHLACQEITDRNFTSANEHLKRTQDIINELTVTLNPDAGELSVNLGRLYEFINYRLLQANIKKDPEMLKEVVQILTTLRSAWAELQTPAKEAVGK